MITASVWLAWFGWLIDSGCNCKPEGMVSPRTGKSYYIFWSWVALASITTAAVLLTIAVNR